MPGHKLIMHKTRNTLHAETPSRFDFSCFAKVKVNS